jgi:uncharacterized membrane protein
VVVALSLLLMLAGLTLVLLGVIRVVAKTSQGKSLDVGLVLVGGVLLLIGQRLLAASDWA